MLIVNSATQPDVRGMGVIALSFQWDYSLPTGTYTLANIPAGYHQESGWTEVAQAFDGTGTAGTIGDADVANGYATAANMALTVASTPTVPAIKKFSVNANAYANGKTYHADGKLQLVWTQGTTPTVGICKGGITMINPKKDGIPTDVTTLTAI